MLFPFRKSHSEEQLLNFLMDHADALVNGTLNLDQLFARYNQVPGNQVEELLRLAERVSHTLTSVNPRDEFVKQLYFELLDAALEEEPSLWQRLRQMPPRKQLAAVGGATLTAGVVFFASRPAREYIRNRRATA